MSALRSSLAVVLQFLLVLDAFAGPTPSRATVPTAIASASLDGKTYLNKVGLNWPPRRGVFALSNAVRL
jgi:hypothetical protein